MLETIRIGSVRFLNAWPLAYGLERRADVTLRLEDPSALAGLLRRGEIDVALAPSIDYVRLVAEGNERAYAGGVTGYVVLPVAAIGSRGTIGSVRLFGYAEADQLRRVVLDPSSSTSNALARLLLARRGVRPHFVIPRPGNPPAARPTDAEVVIGDRALVMDPPGAKWAWDLGEEWHRLVHLPFVYAFWVARVGADLGRLIDVLSAARDQGLAARGELAARAAETLGLSVETAQTYLTHQVRYEFGNRERSGLRAFYRMAADESLVPEGVRLRVAPAARDGAP